MTPSTTILRAFNAWATSLGSLRRTAAGSAGSAAAVVVRAEVAVRGRAALAACVPLACATACLARWAILPAKLWAGAPVWTFGAGVAAAGAAGGALLGFRDSGQAAGEATAQTVRMGIGGGGWGPPPPLGAPPPPGGAGGGRRPA